LNYTSTQISKGFNSESKEISNQEKLQLKLSIRELTTGYSKLSAKTQSSGSILN
jgi:hypothetical protein